MSLSYPFLQIPFIDAPSTVDAPSTGEHSKEEEIVEKESSAKEESGREEEIDNVVEEKAEKKLANDAEESQKEEKDCKERKDETRQDQEKGRSDTNTKRVGNSEEEGEKERVNGDEPQKRDISWENGNQGEGVNSQEEEDDYKTANQQRKIPRVDTWCAPVSMSKSVSAPLHQQHHAKSATPAAAKSSVGKLSATKIGRSSSSTWLRERNR